MPPAPIFVPLPLRGAPDAPAFDGNPQNLFRYFADIEHVCANVGIVPTDDLLIARAIRYLDYDTADLWDCAHPTPPATKFTWVAFKSAVAAFYPGSQDTIRRHIPAHLETIVATTACTGIHTRSDLGAYYRDFYVVADALYKCNRLSTRAADSLFIQAFDTTLRTRIETRLTVKNLDHHPDDPFTIAQVFECAQFFI